MTTPVPVPDGTTPPAASAGLVQPPPGLLDKVAERIFETEFGAYSETACDDHNRWTWRGDGHPEEFKDYYREKARAAWDAVAEGLGLRGRHITDHEIGYFDEDGNAILQYGGTLHQCEDVLARHPNWFHPDAKILVKQWMFLQSSPEGEWRPVGEPQP